ncbi:hypothetical protein Q5752_000479 [Cryptotrichosporon argae]
MSLVKMLAHNCAPTRLCYVEPHDNTVSYRAVPRRITAVFDILHASRVEHVFRHHRRHHDLPCGAFSTAHVRTRQVLNLAAIEFRDFQVDYAKWLLDVTEDYFRHKGLDAHPKRDLRFRSRFKNAYRHYIEVLRDRAFAQEFGPFPPPHSPVLVPPDLFALVKRVQPEIELLRDMGWVKTEFEDLLVTVAKTLVALGLDDTLACLVRTSSVAYDILKPILYRDVTLSARGVERLFDVGPSRTIGIGDVDHAATETLDRALAHARQTGTYRHAGTAVLRRLESLRLIRTMTFLDLPDLDRAATPFWAATRLPGHDEGLRMRNLSALSFGTDAMRRLGGMANARAYWTRGSWYAPACAATSFPSACDAWDRNAPRYVTTVFDVAHPGRLEAVFLHDRERYVVPGSVISTARIVTRQTRTVDATGYEHTLAFDFRQWLHAVMAVHAQRGALEAYLFTPSRLDMLLLAAATRLMAADHRPQTWVLLPRIFDARTMYSLQRADVDRARDEAAASMLGGRPGEGADWTELDALVDRLEPRIELMEHDGAHNYAGETDWARADTAEPRCSVCHGEL